MTRQRIKIVVAVLLAIVGAGLAWRALDRASGHRAPRVPAEVAVEPLVEKTFERIVLDTRPTQSTLESVVAEAADRAREIALALEPSPALPAGRVDDLVEAFRERLAATLGGDFERNRADLLGRGDTMGEQEALERRDAWVGQAAETTLTRIGIEQIDVRSIYERGRRVDPDHLSLGFATLTTSLPAGRFPVSEEAERGRLDVVEVRIPMEKRTMNNRGMRPVLVGYQFAWHAQRSRWVPWRVVLYTYPADAHAAILF